MCKSCGIEHFVASSMFLSAEIKQESYGLLLYCIMLLLLVFGMIMKKLILKFILITVFFASSAVIISHLLTFHERTYITESVSDNPKQIAFTFDDGPSENTVELLAGLSERNAKASFFLLGSHVEKYPELVAKMYEDGHLIGNHTYSHVNLRKASKAELEEQIEKTNAAIEEITGEKPKFFRPPYGAYTALTLERTDEIAVLWSMCPKDWEHEDDEDYICNYIVEHARDGQIVLLHDARAATVPAVLRAMDILKKEGYEFVRADELLCRGGKMLSAGLAYRFCADNGILYWF